MHVESFLCVMTNIDPARERYLGEYLSLWVINLIDPEEGKMACVPAKQRSPTWLKQSEQGGWWQQTGDKGQTLQGLVAQ